MRYMHRTNVGVAKILWNRPLPDRFEVSKTWHLKIRKRVLHNVPWWFIGHIMKRFASVPMINRGWISASADIELINFEFRWCTAWVASIQYLPVLTWFMFIVVLTIIQDKIVGAILGTLFFEFFIGRVLAILQILSIAHTLCTSCVFGSFCKLFLFLLLICLI